MIVIVLGVAFLIFTILYFTPGDPAKLMLGENATVAEVEAMRVKLGIDKPYLAQLGDFLFKTFIKFDLGESWTYSVPVIEELFRRLPRTLLIGICSMFFTAGIGIPVGIFAATHQGKWQDYGIIGACMVFISLPEFWIALMLVIFFSLQLGWLPAYGIGGFSNYILPIASGVFAGVAGNARQARSAMLETIRADFITTARAKGQSENIIIRKHMLPNALMPLVTSLGGRFSHIVAGQAIIERVFTIPGVGLYLLNGISFRDYPVIRGCTLFFAIFSAFVILLVDLIYAWIDPRIKAQYSGGATRARGYKV
jgi:peptide/nickel transport system permease protein